ncbi:MAG: ribonuclease R [Nitrospira sp.]
MNKETILEQLNQKSDHPLLLKELMRQLDLPMEARREVRDLLQTLIQEGMIVKVRGNRYGLPDKMNLVSGRLKGHRDGYGFILPEEEGETDVYIAERRMNGAMHGDRVVARIEGFKSGGRREGSIIRILERAHKILVGRFEVGRRVCFVLASDKRVRQNLLVLPENTLSAKNGDVVSAQILVYPKDGRNPEGKIVKILGRPDDPRIDTEIVISSCGLSRNFPEEVMGEAAHIEDRVTPAMCEGRVDLRALPTVTIDGEKARDFDDAISIEKTTQGGYRLWVHIADVAHYIPQETALDREAYQRGTSVYFPDTVVPMFPEKISNGICSLKPKEDRLTLTAEMEFDAAGNQVGERLYESVIRSDERMTYTAVARICEDRDRETRLRYAALLPQFDGMLSLAMQLRKNRLSRGSLDFDLPEPEIILNLTGETIDIIREERNVAHQIIEAFMLAANETVAGYLTDRNIPLLYRIHETPDPDRISDFNELIKVFGYTPRKLERIQPKELSEILEEVKGKPEERLIHQVLLRTMKQARYSAENKGHFGLASEVYAHFTSPIRRYPDLVVHRLLKRVMKAPMQAVEKEAWNVRLVEIAQHTSRRERIAVEAERDVIQRKKVKFMADKVGEFYPGFISGVAPYGFFVELEDFFVEGLVHVSALHDDYYHYDEGRHCFIGAKRRRQFRLGDPVRICVEKVDLENLQIDFSVVEEKRRKQPAALKKKVPGRRGGKQKRSKKSKPGKKR